MDCPSTITTTMSCRAENFFECNRGQFFLIFLSPRAKLLLLIGRAAKILAPNWLSTRSTFCWFLHFRYPKTTSSFKFFGVRLFKRKLFVPQIQGNQVLQLKRKSLNVKFSCLLQETLTAKDYLSKLKTWIGLTFV